MKIRASLQYRNLVTGEILTTSVQLHSTVMIENLLSGLKETEESRVRKGMPPSNLEPEFVVRAS